MEKGGSDLTWAVVGGQVAAVTGGVGQVRDHHADPGGGTEAPPPRGRLAALRAQRGAGARVRRLPQLAPQEEGPHLAPPGLAPLVVLVVLLAAAFAGQPLAHPAERAVAAGEDGGGRVLLAGPPLPPHALLQLAEGGHVLVLHHQVVHAGGQIVSGELDGDLDVPSLLLFLPRLRFELVPPGTHDSILIFCFIDE